MTTPLPTREAVLRQLEKMLASETFSGAARSRALLKYLIEKSADGASDPVKEYTLGAEALGRGPSFDPRTDPIVRAEASRLRGRIERYYATEGTADEVQIGLPKGSYAPEFRSRAPADDGPDKRGPAVAPARPGLYRSLAWFAVGGVTVGSLLALLLRVPSRPELSALPGPPLVFEVELTRGDRSLGSDFGPDIAISPDGTRLVFVALGPAGTLHLMTRGVGQSDTVELPGTEGARAPFLSPDGKWVGFWADAKLKKTAVDGGAPVVLTDAVDFGGGAWGDDDQIVVALNRTLVKVPSSPGVATTLVDLTKEGISPRWPHLLPGSRHVLYTAIGPAGPNAASIEVLAVAGGQRRVVLMGGTFARHHDQGYLTYVNQGTLFAVPFDPERLLTHGTAAPVREGIAYASTFGFAQLDVSRTGTLVYRRSTARGQRVVSLLQASGKVEPLLAKPGDYSFPRLSPDGRLLALGVAEGGTLSTVVYDRRLERTARLPPAPGILSGVFTPDGRYLVLGSARGLFWTRTDDFAKLEPLVRSDTYQVPWSFSADGRHLGYHSLSPRTAFDVWTVPIEASDGALRAGEPELFLQTPFFETYPSFSPDGRWLAYASGEYGTWGVYVRPFPRRDTAAVRVSVGGGRMSRWRAQERELLYRTDDQRVMAVAYEVKDGTFLPSPPREWTPERLADTGVLSGFDLEPGGDRIVALLPADREEERRVRNQVTLVLNFGDEVKRRLTQGRP